MNSQLLADIVEYVETNIGAFHATRIQNLSKLKLPAILARKNPYLFKAKNILTAQDLVKTLLDAHLSSQEETIFGGFIEGLAIFVNAKIYGGRKSTAEGIDLEFERDGIKYIVTIKSGPNWGNANQITGMRNSFKKARVILRTNTVAQNVVAVNGCCYGRDNQPDKGVYLKLCGQRFWEFLSGNPELYTDIIEPLGHRARERNEEFLVAYAQVINMFTAEFSSSYCKDGLIDWKKLVQQNSSA
jgi:Type II restriction endonuclease EcoO109I